MPPIVRTGLPLHTPSPSSNSYKTPTARDIPPVALTNIQHVEAAESEPYMTRMGPLFEQLQRLKDSEDQALLGNKSDNSFGGHHGASPLSIVPDIYFDEEFQLENPRTFHVVSERSEVVPSTPAIGKASNGNAPAPRKALASNAILQEKLSWYMDTVEVHLINSISMASSTFFSALGSLRELHAEAAESVEKIITLRKDLATLDKDVVTKNQELAQKRRVRHNLQQVHNAVLQLKRVADGVARCESLLDEGEVDEALGEIDAIERLMAGECDERSGNDALTHVPLLDLRGAVALKSVVNDLAVLRSRIGKVFESKVHSLLIGDLRRHVQSVSTRDVLLRWESASRRAKGDSTREPSALPAYMTMTSELRAALAPNIAGLHRSRSIPTTIQTYRELVLREIRSLVRKPLPNSTDDTESITSASTVSGGRSRTTREKSIILAQNLRALDDQDAEDIFTTIFIGVAETLRRLKTQSSILLDIACAIGNPDTEEPVKSPMIWSPIAIPDPSKNLSMFEIQEEMHTALDLPNLLGQAVDVGHEKINKILWVRSEQTTGLPLTYFLRYYTLNLFFANECEAISGRSGTSLKTVVNGHIQDFIKAHGDRENRALAQGMETDTWQDRDFTAKDNEILKQILECSTSDPPAWTRMTKIWPPLSQQTEEMHGSEDSTAKDKIPGATIETETFLLPYSALLCLEGASHFLHLVVGIPSMTPAIAASLVSYLQLFDSRCRQLILGAGALRSAGLKNVTTTHLALTSQALSFMSTIIPHIREFVRRHAPAGPPSTNLVGEFDNVRRAFQEHQDSIYQKLVDIMSSRARLLSKKALETEWAKESAEDVRKYMADLTRDTNKLYKALSKRLPDREVQLVMVPVFTSYKDHLGAAFEEANPESETGRDCMLRDVQHLVDKLGKVEGFGDLGTYLNQIVKGKDM
ncbi:hypothetical protein NM208_g3609 [Fusarium decemcellulare]|uniref:Uncharacterized protein n=1 Tax=Fusarium decemcellulare TaxID=57161 RepID=A0ACC1SNW2_9HYPO|nr:hypothetical protein NM208_g3609 [Fusarium decemcellulare]